MDRHGSIWSAHADAAGSLPHALRQVDVGDDALDELIGLDDDLAGEATGLSRSCPDSVSVDADRHRLMEYECPSFVIMAPPLCGGLGHHRGSPSGRAGVTARR